MDVEALYREHAARLHRYVARLTGDDDAAADAVQETFMRLVEQVPPPREARRWLFTVATRWAMESARTRARHHRLLAGAPLGTVAADPPPDPAAVLDAAERHHLVRNALAALSPRDRTVLLMREEGFAHKEIAAVVGTTTGSVGTIIARALDKLAAELRPRAAARTEPIGADEL
jgi:RNA polymerase sigma-70 factor (ECF subfamily)